MTLNINKYIGIYFYMIHIVKMIDFGTESIGSQSKLKVP